MSLREELIEAGAKAINGLVPDDDRWVARKVLDALLDLLTERADEWREAALMLEDERVTLEPSIARLAAVLRNPGSDG